jgi:RND family efflux transporter MFP subunit
MAWRKNGPRPEKFESTPGSGVTLLVLQRPKVQAEAGGIQAPGTVIHANSASETPPKAADMGRPWWTETQEAGPKPANPPKAVDTPPEVAVVHPIVRQITHHEDFTGHLEAAQSAEVRSRVTGHLAKILFKPGAMVKQGDLLFELDPAQFQAELDKREADVRFSQLRVNRTTAEMKEAKTLSPSDRKRMEAQQAEAEAAMIAAQEALKLAQLNLASTRLTAPISGKIGRPLIAVGSQVTDSLSLATIDSVDPMCVVFNVDQVSVLNLRRNVPNLQGESALSVLVELPDEKGYPHKTRVESADTRIDPATGTARWRALLPNPDGLLMPGMSVRVRLVTSDTYEALLVPETAIGVMGSYPLPHFVWIVTDQNILKQRIIEIGQLNDDGMRVVNKGLSADDWVIPQCPPHGADGSMDIIAEGTTVKPLKPPAAVPPSSSQAAPPAASLAEELKVYGGKSFDQWRELARSDLDHATRVKAFQALGAFAKSGKSNEVLTAILDALKVNQSPDALKAAYTALRLTGPQGEATIISGIRHKDPVHRRAAINVFTHGYGSRRDAYAVPALIEAIDDPDPGIRGDVGNALEHIAVATEVDFTRSPPVHIRPEGEIGPTTEIVVPALCKLLKDTDPTVRRRALASLGRMTSTKASIPNLITFAETAFSKLKAAKPGSQGRSDSDYELSHGVQLLGRMGPAASAAAPLLTAIKQWSSEQTRNPVWAQGAAEKALDEIQGKPK